MTDQEFPSQTQAAQPGYEHDMTPEPEYIRANYRGTAKLWDKVAIITGGDSGIGRAVAVHFAAKAPISHSSIWMRTKMPRLPVRWFRSTASVVCYSGGTRSEERRVGAR